MHSDLEHARRALARMDEAVQRLESHQPQSPEDAHRHDAELHLARLRAYLARGRVIALEKDRLAHCACEEAPRVRRRA